MELLLCRNNSTPSRKSLLSKFKSVYRKQQWTLQAYYKDVLGHTTNLLNGLLKRFLCIGMTKTAEMEITFDHRVLKKSIICLL
ncbi:hypothetical protein XENTR_v10011584 [Xenopus tropicalis]|nr:hypothetical protein XENTR_v10011584 [Xenopus tropicalis]